jgi:hypothetical protein
MTVLDELFDALDRAAKANQQDEFDRLERDLLDRFEGGFAGMPRDVYQRYLEVDRSWPLRLQSSSSGGDAPTGGQGPRLLVNARVPEEFLEWLVALGGETGRSRSDVLTECLNMLRSEPGLEGKLRRALRHQSRESHS